MEEWNNGVDYGMPAAGRWLLEYWNIGGLPANAKRRRDWNDEELGKM